MAKKKLPDGNVIQEAGLFAGVGTSLSGSCAVTSVEFFSVPQEPENSLEAKLGELEKAPGTRYHTAEGARSHLSNLMRS